MTARAATPVVDAGLPVPAFYTTRAGGVSLAPYDSLNLASHVGDSESAVAANRDTLAGLAGAPVAFMAPEHGAMVVRVDGPGQAAPADALLTTVPGLALAALAADCVPLLLAAGTAAVGAVHVGRRGLAAGVVVAAVQALREIAPDVPVGASLGPGVCGRCYEVPAAMRDEVAAVVPASASATPAGAPALDIPGGIVAQLLELDVEVAWASPDCALEDPRWFSHRRDGVTGRFAGVIRLP